MEAIASRYGVDLGQSFLYSDSAADTPLFEAVGTPVVVNPKPPFRAVAEERGWEVVEWHARTGPGGGAARPESGWESWDG